MPSIKIFVMLGIALIFVFLGAFLVPIGRAKKQKRTRSADELPGAHKDWKTLSLGLEKHIYSLRKEIAQYEKHQLMLEKELAIIKEKYSKIQEKFSQERGWKKKEFSDVEKKTKEIIKLQKDLTETEQSLSKEHGQKLRIERDLNEIRNEASESAAAKKNAEAELDKLKARTSGFRKEILDLRELNNRLTKQHNDTTWIAKSEYVKVEKKLKEAEKELEKLKPKSV